MGLELDGVDLRHSYQVLSMDQDPGIEALLDLSFLTEEEQNAIVEVLHRDLQLQMCEKGRIK